MIEKAIANEIITQTMDRGSYLPLNTKSSRIVLFHLDDTNFHEDGDDRKNATNALLLVGSQYKNEDITQETFTVPRSKTTTLLPNNFGCLLDFDFNVMNLYQRFNSWSSFQTYIHMQEPKRWYQEYLKPWVLSKSIESALSTHKIREIEISLDINDALPIEVQLSTDEEIEEQEQSHLEMAEISNQSQSGLLNTDDKI